MRERPEFGPGMSHEDAGRFARRFLRWARDPEWLSRRTGKRGGIVVGLGAYERGFSGWKKMLFGRTPPSWTGRKDPEGSLATCTEFFGYPGVREKLAALGRAAAEKDASELEILMAASGE